MLARLAPDDPEPWTCDYCGLVLHPLNNEEMWRYVRTGESRNAANPRCMQDRVNHGKRRPRPPAVTR